MLQRISRRDAIVGGMASAVSLMSSAGKAETAYPKETINFICAFPPGSGADVLVRFYANKLGPIVGVPIVVQNKAGASGNIAAEYTARAKPDGYTIMVHGGSSIAGNMHLFKKPPIDVTKELKVTATLSQLAFMLLVPTNSPYKTLQDLTAAMKAKGDKGTYGTPNTSSLITGELYKQIAGLKTVHVNYRTSADFINDLASGNIDYAITDAVSSLAQTRQGQSRMLAISSAKRMASTPDLPTFAEGGVPGINMTSWWGAMVPTATPQPIVDQINKWFVEALKSPDTVEFLKAQGNDVFITSPQDGQKELVRSVEEWKTYVEVAKIEKQ